jgi:hypothetical protein
MDTKDRLMDPKEISAFLARPRLTIFEMFLVFVGAAIALLLVSTATTFYKHDYRDGIWCFITALVLGFVFFRKRKVALVVTTMSCILALTSLGLPFHPSYAGLALLLGSGAALYWTIRWQAKKYPYLSYIHMHSVFEGEEATAAENARVEAQARELVKNRPFGPWLFR